MVKGIIETVEDDAVEINGTFYRLGPKIKSELIGKGPCEYSLDEDGETAKFIRMDKPVAKQRTFGKPKPEAKSEESHFRDPTEIIREGCLNVAAKICISNSKGDAVFTRKEVIDWAKAFEAYVTDNEEKPE